MKGFETEKELVKTFRETYLAKHYAQALVCEEMGLGFGIADLVIAEIKDPIHAESCVQLNASDIHVYQYVSKEKRASVDQIVHATGINGQQVSRSLVNLLDRALITQEEALYTVARPYALSYKKAVAFEAKLRNWKKAFLQAYRYKWFADCSYVVLDTAHSKNAVENIQQFVKGNVGLISVSTDGSVCVYHTPKKQKPIDPSMQILFSETLLYS